MNFHMLNLSPAQTTQSCLRACTYGRVKRNSLLCECSEQPVWPISIVNNI